MDLLTVCQAVEQACAQFQHPATRAQAEQTLLEFRNSPQALAASEWILTHSQDVQAQFQAVLALRHAVLAGWTGLPRETQQGAVQFLLQHALLRAASQQPLVAAQCQATAAALIKRGWEGMTVEERHALMQGIDSTAAQAGTPDARRASLQLLAALVQEFTPATASSLGLPWDHHERCRADMEATYLQGLFVHALNSARESAPAAVAGADEGGVCLASLGLLAAILSWDFSRAGGSGVWRLDPTNRPNEVVHVRPPLSWAELLMAPASWDWLETLLQATRGPHKSATPLARAARQLLCLLCSLSGDIFPRPQQQQHQGQAHAARAELGLRPAVPAGPEGPKDQHLLRVLRMLLPLVVPPAAAVHAAAADDEGELLDACRGLLAAAAVHRAPGFERVGAALDLPHSGGVLGVLSELTQAALGAGGANPEDAGWATEVADMLLEAWVELLADPCRGPVGSSPAAVAAAGAVFGAVMEAALRDAAAGAHEDAEDEEGGEGAVSEEWLERVAAVGRAAAPAALPALAQRMQQCQGELAACMQAGRDPSAVLEQLCWVVSMAAHVLADAGDGETPLVPLAVLEACTPAWAAGGPQAQQAQQAGEDPAVALGRCLLGVGAMCLEEAARPVISPRLMEVVVAALGRWADTYLLPDEPASPALEAAFGDAAPAVHAAPAAGPPGQPPAPVGGQGPAVLESLVQLLLAALTRFPGETALHEAACQRLLGPLARRWRVSRLLVASPAWASLTGAIGEGAPGICQLAAPVQRRLVQGVCLAAEGLRPDSGDAGGAALAEATNRYISGLLQHTVSQLQALGAEQNKVALLQRADTMQRAAGLLESMRGAARGVLPHSQAAVFAQFTAVSQALVTLLSAYCHHPAMVALILKLAAEVAEGVVGALSAAQAGALFAWALQLLRVYADKNVGQVSVQLAPTLQAERQTERYKDLRALLKLLTNLSHRDWSDVCALTTAEARAGAGDDVAQVVFAGLDIILPLVSPELLQFPKLGRAYFTLLAYMAEVYPERLAALPGPLFGALASTLRYGVGVSGDPEITQAVFEALAALAKFHAVATAGGNPGLGPNNTGSDGGPSMLGILLQATLERILQDDAGHEAVDHAAEALLPLILAEPAALQAAGEALLASLPEQSTKDKVTAAFLELTAGVERSLDRGNRQRFRANLLRFAGEVRGAVRVR